MYKVPQVLKVLPVQEQPVLPEQPAPLVLALRVPLEPQVQVQRARQVLAPQALQAPPDQLVQEVEEMARVGREAGVRGRVSHEGAGKVPSRVPLSSPIKRMHAGQDCRPIPAGAVRLHAIPRNGHAAHGGVPRATGVVHGAQPMEG